MPSLATTLLIPLAAAAVVALLAAAAAWTAGWIVKHQSAVRRAARRVYPLVERIPGVRALEHRFPPLLRLFHHRMTAAEYLGLHLVAGALVCIAGLAIFGRLLVAVVEREKITRFDLDIAQNIYEGTTSWGVEMWGFVSHLGTNKVTWTIGLILGVVLWRRGVTLFLPTYIVGVFGATVLNAWLKLLVRRTRPFWEEPLATSASFSFPSGHSMGSLVGYGFIAYGIYLLTRKRSIWLPSAVVCLIIVLAVGYSRMYLGVHFFTDVIGGFSLGAFWLAACVTGIAVAERLQFRNGKRAR